MGYQKGRRIRLWNSDLEILAREFPEVDEVAANSWFDNHTATYGNEYTKVWLRGSLPKIEQIEGVEIVKGRFVNDADIREYRKSLVIDQAMQSLLFKGADPLGSKDQARQHGISPWSASTRATPSAAVRRVTSRSPPDSCSTTPTAPKSTMPSSPCKGVHTDRGR